MTHLVSRTVQSLNFWSKQIAEKRNFFSSSCFIAHHLFRDLFTIVFSICSILVSTCFEFCFEFVWYISRTLLPLCFLTCSIYRETTSSSSSLSASDRRASACREPTPGGLKSHSNANYITLELVLIFFLERLGWEGPLYCFCLPTGPPGPKNCWPGKSDDWPH